MIDVSIKSIPHEDHRYPTSGDYWQENGIDLVRVSAMPDWRHEALIAVHELVEYFICKSRGIQEPDILAFDLQYEKERERGEHGCASEPGFDSRSPYREAHHFATGIEMLLAKELGVDWNTYEEAVNSL